MLSGRQGTTGEVTLPLCPRPGWLDRLMVEEGLEFEIECLRVPRSGISVTTAARSVSIEKEAI